MTALTNWKKGTGSTYSFNEDGERIKTTPSGAPTTYGYNQAGDLTSVERPEEGKTAAIKDTYAFNGDGLRVSETISGTTNYLAWDLAEGLPSILSNGTYSYIYGPGGLPIEQINGEGKAYYLHHDEQGSTRLLTGSTGKTEATMTYSPYGSETGSTGSITTRLGYDGQYTSPDSGLIYMQARVYDPATAQFLTVDPLVASTQTPYAYVGDSPLNYRDRRGLGWEEVLEPSIPCPWCEAQAGIEEALEGPYHAVQHGAEALYNELAVEELGEPVEQGSRSIECDRIPTGSKPPPEAYRELEKETGLGRRALRNALHKIKEGALLKGKENTRIDSEGNVYDEETGEYIGNIIDEAHG